METKNPQSNAMVDQVHQVILNMFVTKDPYKKSSTIYIHGMKP